MTDETAQLAARRADADLIARFARGDETAARLLTAQLLPRVYAHALRVLGNTAEAEDVAQEAMVRLWRQAPNWEADRARASTWLYRVTANLCSDRLRKQPAQSLDAVAAPEDPAPGPATRMLQTARHDALQAALQTLPERQRQAVVLRHLEGLANPEIAEILGLGVAAVESLTARGKRALIATLAARRDALGYDDE